MTRTPEDWDEYALGLLGENNCSWAERVDGIGEPGFGWHMLQKAILNDYWMDNGRGPDANFKNFDAERMNEFVAKIYYCWVQMLRAQQPELFEHENEGLVE
jgi:hypothetical protein